MRIEDELRRDRLDPVLPHTLTPPPDLADTVLAGVRRRRQRGPLVAVAVAAAAAVAIATPIVVLRPDADRAPGAPATPTATETPAGPAPTQLPALDGGPRTLHAFTYAATGRTSLLDVRTGRYREFPYEIQLSPDLRRVAVAAGGRVGVADRAALLRDGDRALSWTTLPGGAALLWSPAGSALMLTTIDKSAGPVTYTVLRYDLRTRLVTSTPVPSGTRLIGYPTWAANSKDYLMLPVAEEEQNSVTPGPLRTLHPDGTLGPVAGAAGAVDGPSAYSPSGRLMIADTSQIMGAAPSPSTVLDVRTGAVVGTLPAGGGRVVGWYDERTVVRLNGFRDTGGPMLVLVEARTGRTVRTVDLPGGVELTDVRVGSSRGVSAEAPRF